MEYPLKPSEVEHWPPSEAASSGYGSGRTPEHATARHSCGRGSDGSTRTPTSRPRVAPAAEEEDDDVHAWGATVGTPTTPATYVTGGGELDEPDSVALAAKLKRSAQSFASLLRAGAEGSTPE